MRISQYPNITTLADTDLLLVQTSIDGAYKNIAVSDFKLYFGGSSDSSGISGSTASDSYFNYVVLLLPLSGSDETTTFTDIKGNTVTYVGSAIITTRESKFGDGSLYLLGNEAFLSVASSTTFNFGNNDLDIEFWIYPVATGQQVILERRSTGFTAGDWVIWYSSGGSNATVSMISYDFDGVGNNFISTNNGDVPVNTWSLITIQKSESNWTIRVNGATKGAATTSFSFANSTQPITIGADIAGNGRYYLNAYLQDIRITIGVARYSADFTPSTTAFPQQGSSSTPSNLYASKILALSPYLYWRFQETSGTIASDASGNGNAGTYSNCTLGQPSSISASGTSILLNGSNSIISTNVAVTQFNPLTVSCRFKTTNSTQAIWEFDSTSAGTGGSFSPALVMSNGQLSIYGYPGGTNFTSETYNDGAWHQAIAVMTSTSCALYVDGVEVASSGNNALQSFSGYFVIGYSQSNSIYFNGSIAEFAIFQSALNATQITAIQSAVTSSS